MWGLRKISNSKTLFQKSTCKQLCRQASHTMKIILMRHVHSNRSCFYLQPSTNSPSILLSSFWQYSVGLSLAVLASLWLLSHCSFPTRQPYKRHQGENASHLLFSAVLLAVHCTMSSAESTLCTLQCRVHSVRCTVHSANCTLDNMSP